MPSECQFEFDRPEPIYYSGETINGRINLKTTSEKTVNEVYINFLGEAKVRWSEQKSRTRNGKTEHYTEHYWGSEIYAQSRTNVFGKGTLPIGTHTYTFCIPLPRECPSSCVEAYGHIRYEVSLVLDRPLRFDNVYKQPVSVIKYLDLNQNPAYLIPVNDEDIKYFCCWPCSSGPVISKLLIPFSGYAPGQKINFTLEIDNQSHGYDLDGIEFKLKQIYRFDAQVPSHRSRHQNNTLASDQHEEKVLRLSKRIIKGTLAIPSVPPSSMQNGILTVRYVFKMSITTGACHTDSDIEIPIVIGTVPLYQSAENPESLRMLPQPTAPDMPATPDSLDNKPPKYELLKPPSFEEAMSTGEKFIDIDVDERQRVDDFVPKYPMYINFAMPTAPIIREAEEAMTTNTQNEVNSSATDAATTATLPYPVNNAGMPVLPSNANMMWFPQTNSSL